MIRRVLCLLFVFWLLPVPATAAPSKAQTAEEATIYRDEFGIPHVFAANLETAAYGVGYAQAEDRLEEMLKNYRRANGRIAEVVGPYLYPQDLVMRMMRNEEVSREKYKTLSPKVRGVIEAFIAGVKRFMKDHPEQVPAWAQEIHPWDVVSLSRFIILGWPLDEAFDSLGKVGIKPDALPYHGSNEMLIAPSRTTFHAPIAVIDPHLSWYDEFRFYEARIYAGDFAVSGVCILGAPFPSLGHSRWCSVAMTTGGPITSDVYEETVNPANPHQYRYDGKWREMTVRMEKIGVKIGNAIRWKEVEVDYTHHGPIVAHKNGKDYAMAIPYADQVGLSDQIYAMFTAHNLKEMKRALAMRQLMSQNIMVGTVQGDIYYVRNGRVPIRAKGVDPTQPVPGDTSKTEWKGLHPFSDLVQITNPPQGYMENCNVTPFGMMRNSPLTPEKYAAYPYLYNATRTDPLHQRAQMMTELLDKADHVTLEQAIDIAFNPTVYHAGLWQARLKEAWERADAAAKTTDASVVYAEIAAWNDRSDADSTGALAFYAFKRGLGKYAESYELPKEITDADLLTGLTQGAQWLQSKFGSLHVAFGTYFRVGRKGGERTWPVGGGSLFEAGMATPRAITFGAVGDKMVGHTGQTSTQIVILTNPPKSYAIIPLGESDHKESGHWDDQAEKLFSKSIAYPTFFLDKAELMKHVTATEVLRREP